MNSQYDEMWKVVRYDFSDYMVSKNRIAICLKDNKQEILTQSWTGNSKKHDNLYCSVLLIGDNMKKKRFLIHRLVAIAFIPNPKNLHCVDHIDHNKDNNKTSNLRWCTHHNNQGNQKKQQKKCYSKFKSVSWNKLSNK